MYDSRLIANRFIDLALRNSDALTPMQIIKLVYISHGWMLGLYHRPLIYDEIQAWQYGPVIPRLYNALRKNKGNAVREFVPASTEDIDNESENIVGQVYEKYGKMSGPALSRITHASGTPWDLVYEPGTFGLVIPNDIIEDHYAKMAAK